MKQVRNRTDFFAHFLDQSFAVGQGTGCLIQALDIATSVRPKFILKPAKSRPTLSCRSRAIRRLSSSCNWSKRAEKPAAPDLYRREEAVSAAVVAQADTAASGSENGFSRPGICQCHVLKRADEPRIVMPGEHGKDQRIDLMRAGRVSSTDRKATPEMYNRRPIADRDHIDQIIFEIRIAIDRLVDGNVEVDDFFDAAHIVPEPIHECRVAVEQGSESLHVVSIPGGLECVGDILRSFHLSHVDSRKGFGRDSLLQYRIKGSRAILF